MELQDCAFPTLTEVIASDNASLVFTDADFAFLVGSKPRGPGMERGDLLKQNGEIFVSTGETINKYAKPTVKVLVVGNPANTNCLIAMHNAPNIPKENFTAMTRLDHNRALAQLANRTDSHVNDVKKLAIWGNHSSTMYPDLTNATVKGKPATQLVAPGWVNKEFIPVVQQRGASIIAARGASSAASAASSAIDHVRDWVLGSHGQWVSMAVLSNLFPGAYGVPAGLIFSYPMTTSGGKFHLVPDLPLDQAAKDRLKKTADELLSERQAVEGFLKH
jgi:malate dehydrogenase